MSQINCNIAGDLIPLYVDDVLCEDSVTMLEEHLSTCESCTAKVEALRQDTVLTADSSAEPLQKIKRQINCNKRIVALVVLLVTVGLVYWTAFFSGMIQWDISYSSVKDRIAAVSVSDSAHAAGQKAGQRELIVYSGKPDFHENACCEITGEKDGIKQVEVTMYLSRGWWDIVDYLGKVRETAGDIDWNHLGQPYSLTEQIQRMAAQVRALDGLQVIYEVTSPESGEDHLPLREDIRESFNGNQGNVTVYHDIESFDKAEGGEIVAVYYGRFKVNRASEISYSGSRHLLWAKDGDDGAA